MGLAAQTGRTRPGRRQVLELTAGVCGRIADRPSAGRRKSLKTQGLPVLIGVAPCQNCALGVNRVRREPAGRGRTAPDGVDPRAMNQQRENGASKRHRRPATPDSPSRRSATEGELAAARRAGFRRSRPVRQGPTASRGRRPGRRASYGHVRPGHGFLSAGAEACHRGGGSVDDPRGVAVRKKSPVRPIVRRFEVRCHSVGERVAATSLGGPARSSVVGRRCTRELGDRWRRSPPRGPLNAGRPKPHGCTHGPATPPPTYTALCAGRRRWSPRMKPGGRR